LALDEALCRPGEEPRHRMRAFGADSGAAEGPKCGL
jgi:hypothetical protein